MTVMRNEADGSKFNKNASLPFELRLTDFQAALQDVYDFFFDVNCSLVGKGLERLDEMLRPAIMSGVLSDMLTASLAKHSRTLVVNSYFNGHPDLIVKGKYANNAEKAGEHGSRSRPRASRAEPSTRTAREISGCACSSTASTTRRSPRSVVGR